MAGFLGEEILRSTIREWASTDCEPHPCGLSVWRYASAISDVDAPELPPHQTRKALHTLLRERGGLEGCAREFMEALGWREVAKPRRGDVGVVSIPSMGLTCAICLGERWMAKGSRNVLTLRAPHRAAWRFN